MRDIVLYCTDTMADWEYAYLTAGLAMAVAIEQPSRWRLRVLADRQEQVVTFGGLHLVPDGDLDAVDVEEIAMLVLPGGNTWATGHERVLDLATTLLDQATWWPRSAGQPTVLPALGCWTSARTLLIRPRS